MRPWARPGKVVSIAVCTIAVAIAATGSAPVDGLAVGDYWTYRYHQLESGVEWVGNVTQEFIGSIPGNLLAFRFSGGGLLGGDISGTWNLDEVNGYRPTDGAFVNSTSTLELEYVEFGDLFHVVDVSSTSNNPPVDLGGPLEVGAVTSGTTTETITLTRTVNGNATGPTTQSSTITLTERIIGRIQVSVPAGVFTAWQIRFTRSDTPGYVEYAYDETVGSSVQVLVIDGFENQVASLALTGYQYQPGAIGSTPAPSLPAVPLGALGATAAVVAAIVWWDRRKRSGSGPGGPAAPGGSPPPPPSQP